MAKPRLIILVRHAQSEGNKNREIHQTIPDHRVKLTQDGWQQAYEAGRRLRTMLRADDTLHFFTSPYRRTRETTEGILKTLTSDDPGPSPFKRNNIKVYEEPRLREQDFGNFQPCSAEMERMWQERADYGHFFYRIPNGESAADAYDRISGFNESLWRQFGEDDFASVCVLVTHGLMSRVFLMKWYHFSVEYFEDLRNVNHCEFLIMRKEESGKYTLENKLRTWSELRKERAILQKQKEEEAAKDGSSKEAVAAAATTPIPGAGGNAKDGPKLERTMSASSSPVIPRRWGGCPNGCNHDKNFKIRSGLADLVRRDGTAIYHDKDRSASSTTIGNPSSSSSSSLGNRRPAARRFQSTTTTGGSSGHSDDGDDEKPMTTSTTINTTTHHAAPRIDITKAREEVVSSPDATPSFITVDDRLRAAQKSPGQPPKPFLHIGRDFGGTYSGHTSDADSSEDDRTRRRMMRIDAPTAAAHQAQGDANGHHHHHHHQQQHHLPAKRVDLSGMRRKSMANRLGDAPHCSECENDRQEQSDGTTHSDETTEQDAEPHRRPAAAAAAPPIVVKSAQGASNEELLNGDDADLDKAEREDRSIEGSVY